MTGLFRRQIPLLENRWLYAALFALLFITSFSLSGTLLPNSTNIDASWQASIEYAAAHNWLFGSDILFTYGPLGYLTSRFGQGFLQLPRIMAAFAMSGVTAWLVLQLAKSLPGLTALMLLGWLTLFATAADAEQNIFFIIAGCSLALMADKRPLWTLLLLPPLLAAVSLVKFTFFIAAVSSILICSMHLLLKKDRRGMLLLATTYGAAFCLLWKLTGQQLGNFSPWIKGSLALSSGYSEAMALTPAPLVIACASLSLLILLVPTAWPLIRREQRWYELAPLFILLTATFITWKQGVVRADELHFARFAFSIPLLLALALSRLPGNSSLCRNNWLPPLLLGTTMFLGLLAVQLSFPANLSLGRLFDDFLRKTPVRLTQIVKISVGKGADCFPESRAKVVRELPTQISDLVGQGSIDVMGSASWFAIGSGMNYRPRPVVQSYSAYNPYLQNVNLAFLQSSKRPDWMLVMMDCLDDRLPVMEDALLFPWILRNYELAWHDDTFLLFRAKPAATAPQSRLLFTGNIVLGDRLDLAAVPQTAPLIMQVELSPSLIGKLAGFFYQRPPLQLTLEYDDEQLDRRFVPQMATEGFLLNPLLLNVEDVAAYRGGKSRRLKGITFTAPRGAKIMYRAAFTVKLRQIDL